ncbi:c-type cytochrome biogenesis protein CcmI [Rhodovulum sp. YNF3179]|uniref:c-type cytochrome biogenesis protein CcmI n=1 Tax=Rhodovulum sp. YNF3179 TaxID=3425127 RepID=UPI003D330454
MGFWLTAIGLAVIVTIFLVLALLRARDAAAPAAAYDLQVYRDQLREVERDHARGLLSADDAERARIEISRKILEADRALKDAGGTGGAPPRLTAVASALTALVVIGGGVGLYLVMGVPGAQDVPLAGRLAAIEESRTNRPTQQEAESNVPEVERLPEGASDRYLELVRQLRATVAERPDDMRGNALLARHEAALGNFRAAYAAKGRVIAARGDTATAQDYAELAELMILAVNGYVSPEAERALGAALSRDEENPTARYYSGLMFAQSGRYDRAFRLWRGLLQDSQPDAPWVGPIRSQIEDIARLAGENYTLPPAPQPGPAAPGPSQADIEAAGDMSAEDRDAMIRGMVGQLNDRLAAEGGSASEWARLIGAYGVLGETERAAAIWQEAQAKFAADPEGLAQIRAAARQAGVAE